MTVSDVSRICQEPPKAYTSRVPLNTCAETVDIYEHGRRQSILFVPPLQQINTLLTQKRIVCPTRAGQQCRSIGRAAERLRYWAPRRIYKQNFSTGCVGIPLKGPYKISKNYFFQFCAKAIAMIRSCARDSPHYLNAIA